MLHWCLKHIVKYSNKSFNRTMKVKQTYRVDPSLREEVNEVWNIFTIMIKHKNDISNHIKTKYLSILMHLIWTFMNSRQFNESGREGGVKYSGEHSRDYNIQMYVSCVCCRNQLIWKAFCRNEKIFNFVTINWFRRITI